MRTVQSEKILKLLGITCESVQPKWVNFTKCLVKPMKNHIAEVTVEVALIVKPINNATLVGELVKHGYEDRPPVAAYEMDCCDFFRKKRRKFMANVAYKAMGLDKYSNMNHSCPYDHDLIVDRYPFNGHVLGKIIPFGNGEFTFNTKWYSYNVLRAVVRIRVRLFDD
ncbi:uncharacterized protein LOC101460696 [Ceratitis capitata]|uniref:uncharacterized protein LOC101460696 n=1 Tax=Ceratitis capitata TaxID=7213 RepID=UPI00032A2243|nr:uncharacterized protein LOC101460696 [Ceratitis capitata]